MQEANYAIGQAVFIKTDTPDYEEETIPFKSLAEMVKLCSTSYPNLTLEKVLIYSLVDSEPVAVTLSFLAASRGQRPDSLIRELED